MIHSLFKGVNIMNLFDLKKREDDKELNELILNDLRFKLHQQTLQYEKEVKKYEKLENLKRKEARKKVENEFEAYFKKENFIVNKSTAGEKRVLTAEYKGLKVEMEIEGQGFLIKFKQMEVNQRFDIEIIEEKMPAEMLEGWKLYKKYKDNYNKIVSVSDAEKILKYFDDAVGLIVNAINKYEEVECRYKYYNHNKFCNSLFDILNDLFNH